MLLSSYISRVAEENRKRTYKKLWRQSQAFNRNHIILFFCCKFCSDLSNVILPAWFSKPTSLPRLCLSWRTKLVFAFLFKQLRAHRTSLGKNFFKYLSACLRTAWVDTHQIYCYSLQVLKIRCCSSEVLECMKKIGCTNSDTCILHKIFRHYLTAETNIIKSVS